MANKNLFQTVRGLFTPKTDCLNEAGGTAYRLTPKAALAQYAATGCLSHTFYADAGEQLDKILELTRELDAEFIAKVAVYSRERAFLKDVPALLVAVLSTKDRALFEKTFPRVIDNGKMLRNFVQIMRSGLVGRKSLGTLPKRMVREWFEKRGTEQIFRQSIGQSPSIADILKMVHPKPADEVREALFGYFIGREIDADKLPEIVKHFERFKSGHLAEVPNVPFQMLTALPLGAKEWTAIAREFWKKANVADRITLILKPGRDVIGDFLAKGEAGKFDMMFIDADKHNYDHYYEGGLKLLRAGGLMLIDNVLWGGDVADPSKTDADTSALRALNAKIRSDSRVDFSMVPIGDGLSLVRKK